MRNACVNSTRTDRNGRVPPDAGAGALRFSQDQPATLPRWLGQPAQRRRAVRDEAPSYHPLQQVRPGRGPATQIADRHTDHADSPARAGCRAGFSPVRATDRPAQSVPNRSAPMPMPAPTSSTAPILKRRRRIVAGELQPADSPSPGDVRPCAGAGATTAARNPAHATLRRCLPPSSASTRSSARVTASNRKSVSARSMMSGGQNEMTSPSGRRMTP
jgi:hypothetical protein